MTKEKRWDHALGAAVKAVLDSGRIARNFFRLSDLEVQLKIDGTPVTQADKEANRVIVEELMRFDPHFGFLSEETGEYGAHSRRWIIDPLDATKNFIGGIPFWAVLVAYEEDGEVVAGVIHEPANGGNLWTARKGGGAFLNGHPIRVSNVEKLEKALLLHGSVRHLFLGAEDHWRMFANFLPKVARTRGLGDYTNFTWLAEGLGDIAFDTGLKVWDVAAPSIVVTEAGGRFTYYPKSGMVIATNGLLYDEVAGVFVGA